MKYGYFVFFGITYLAVRIFEFYQAVPFNWMSFYLTDFCAMPLVLGLLLFALRLLKKNQRKLPIWFVIAMTAYWSIYFEYYLPQKSSAYTQDWLDVLMYALGSFSFLLWQLKFIKKA